MTTKPEVLEHLDLMLLLGDENEIRCEASQTAHKCQKKAKWLCYATPNCSSIRQAVVPWCQGRYEVWLKQRERGIRCRCKNPTDHYRVLPI